MSQTWDVLVIGGGVAGLSAATAAAEAGLSVACIERMAPGGQVMNLAVLHDYPEAAPGASGADLAAAMLDAASAAGVESLFGEVRALGDGPPWEVLTDDETHYARAVIVATGLSAGSFGIEGEEEFEGRGVSHCASCDGPIFAGQDVAVAGSGRWAAEEALELAPIVAHVTLIGDPGPDAARLAAAGNVSVLPGKVVKLEGTDGLDGVVVAHEGGETALPVPGIFAYVDRAPLVDFASGRLRLGPDGGIATDAAMGAGAPLVFAAGDVRSSAAQTIAAAIADGRAAGRAAAEALARHR